MSLFSVLGVSLLVALIPAQSKVPAQLTATITGESSYPSDFDFPLMIVCAEAITSKSIHCTGKRIQNRRSRKGYIHTSSSRGELFRLCYHREW